MPPIKVDGAAYFITFRLADSLPREAVLLLKEQRADLLRRAADAKQDQTVTQQQLHAWYAAEVDSVLDQHTGEAWLRDSRIADIVVGAIRHFEGTRYATYAWCVMPNHVHAVLRPMGAHSLEEILHSWKSFTALEANRRLARTGKPFWQHESYDHWIRDDLDLAHCCRYTEENPVKANLCASADAWPWGSAAKK